VKLGERNSYPIAKKIVTCVSGESILCDLWGAERTLRDVLNVKSNLTVTENTGKIGWWTYQGKSSDRSELSLMNKDRRFTEVLNGSQGRAGLDCGSTSRPLMGSGARAG